MAIDAAKTVRDNWIEAASDGVVTNHEIYQIYAAAKHSGVSTEDLLSAAKITRVAADAVRTASRAEREAAVQAKAAQASADQCLVDGLRKPCADLASASEQAKARRARAEQKLFSAEDNLPQARKLQRLLRDEYDAQPYLDTLWADVADF